MSVCRQRKVICAGCGNTARQTRSWMMQGLLACPCGGKLRPESPADLAYIGLIGQEDMSQAAWNAICRELGWPIVLNQGQATQALNKGRTIAPTLSERASKPMCAYTGCGRWVAADTEHCAAHAPVRELEPSMPF
jgi:hypothetical protein